MKPLRAPRLLFWLLLAAAAGALLWFNAQQHKSLPHPASKTALLQPDWVAHQASSWRLDLPRQEQFFVQAERATHWKKADLTDLKQPHGWLAKPDGTYRFTAEQGRTDSHQVRLQGQARIQQLAPRALSLQSDRLDYDRAQRVLATQAPVRLTAQRGWTTGVGLQWWLDAKRLIIQREVHTHYAP